MNQIFSKPALLASAAFFAAAAIAACGNDSTAPGGGAAAAIAASRTPPAGPTVASAVPGPSVIVTSSDGTPVKGAVVTFAVTAGGGAIQYSTATSDDQGIASAGLWQIGPKVGVNTVTATVEGVAPLSFSVTSLPGAPSKVAANSGGGEQGPPGTTASNPLSVRVTDAGGNVKPGVTVTFTVVAGGGSIAGGTATTDAQGIATSGAWTFGSCRAQIVQAQAGALGATFTGTVTGQPAIVGGAAAGALTTTDCVINGAFADEYDLTTASEAVNIALTSPSFDALLNISNATGLNLIGSNDNAPGSGTNSALRLIAAATTKTVTATSAAAGQTGAYSIAVTSTSSAVTDCSPVYIEIGATTSQTLASSDCSTNYQGVAGDQFLVYIPAGVTVRISQTAVPLDALIAFLSPTGSLIVERDNGGVGATQTEIINFTAPTAGFYKIVASSYCLVYDDPYQAGCDYGPYTLSVITP